MIFIAVRQPDTQGKNYPRGFRHVRHADGLNGTRPQPTPLTYVIAYAIINVRNNVRLEQTMTSVSATALRKDLYNIIAQTNENCAPITITNTKGKGAVLIGEDEWAAIEETLYLMGIPGMAQSLIDGRDTPAEECVDETALEW